MKRLSLYFSDPRELTIIQDDLPPLQADQVLVQTILSAISPGTELLFYRAQFPRNLPVDEYIPALQQAARYPLKYGYSLVGRVVAVGTAIEPVWQDRLVFAFHPHESHFTSKTGDLLPIPDGVSLEDAVLLPNMETAINLVMDGAPIIGERVVIFGQGIVGLLTSAVLARFPLSSLITLDHYPIRRQASIKMGAQTSFDSGDIELVKTRIPSGADLTYELSGSPEALDQAIAVTGYAGRVVIGSWYGEKKAKLDLGGRFHRSRIRLVSSQVSTIAPDLAARWTKARRFDVTWEMLSEIRPSRLITHRMSLRQAETAYRLLDQEPNKAIQIIFTYDQDWGG